MTATLQPLKRPLSIHWWAASEPYDGRRTRGNQALAQTQPLATLTVSFLPPPSSPSLVLFFLPRRFWLRARTCAGRDCADQLGGPASATISGSGDSTSLLPSLQDCQVSPVAAGFGRRLAAAAPTCWFLLVVHHGPVTVCATHCCECRT